MFNCRSNFLTNLLGGPESTGIDFVCSMNNLISLKGAPKFVGDTFYCDENKLTSLLYSPKNAHYFWSAQNHLLSRDYFPNYCRNM
jgi:hypothetical protein